MSTTASGRYLKDLIKPDDGRGRQVSSIVLEYKDPEPHSEPVSLAINLPSSRQLYSQSLGAVAPVNGNIFYYKWLTQHNRAKVTGSIIRGIHAFDQWGVELNKKIATDLEAASRGASGV